MKKKIYFLPLALLALFGTVQYGCQEEPEEICESFDAQCGAPIPATSCCTENNCYYEYDGEAYPDTDEGTANLIADMCGGDDEQTSAKVFSIKEELKAQTQRLLAEARADAVCQY
jgi:hypothetical protein